MSAATWRIESGGPRSMGGAGDFDPASGPASAAANGGTWLAGPLAEENADKGP